MKDTYFKYKALSLDGAGLIDGRTRDQVIAPMVESYYYLPTRQKLNDPNEGMFKSLVQKEFSSLLRRTSVIGERENLTQALLRFESQLSVSTDNSGVFSLSHTVTDELMWSHYCDSHCGIAIEYDLDQLTRFSSSQHLHRFKVNYSSHPPELSLQKIQSNPRGAIITMLGHKSPRWSYEEEFRVLLENINSKVPHDYRAVKSITFGLKVPAVARDQIYEATKSKVPNYFEILQVKNSYQLERVPINRYSGSSPTGKERCIAWEAQFESIDDGYKDALCEWARNEIESDPHFYEFWMVERSTIDPSKAVLQYEATHQMGLEPCVSNTKIFCEI